MILSVNFYRNASIIFLSLISMGLSAQSDKIFTIGPRIGVTSGTDQLGQLIGESGADLSIRRLPIGAHAGLFSRLKLGVLVLQPEALLHIQTLKINSDASNTVEQVFSLNLPLLAGLQIGKVRALAGPVLRIGLDGLSDLTDFDGLQSKFKNTNVGYQAGIGFDVKNLAFDVKYEGNLVKFGNDLELGGKKYNFNNAAKQIVVSVGYMF